MLACSHATSHAAIRSHPLRAPLLFACAPAVPVIQMRAILGEKEDTRGIYRCPVYKQTERATPGYHTPGSGYLFMMQLKTKQPDTKWIMAGVALLAALD